MPPGEPSAIDRLAVLEHDGRRHRGARPLAGLDAVGDRAPSVAGDEGEVGELVVEQEAADHQPRAEGVLDRRGHRGDVAVGIDDDEMRGRRHVEREAVDAQFGLVPGRLAGLRPRPRRSAVGRRISAERALR